ncbi:MAG: hypothetical protein ABSC53_15740 [Bacteroidota bacterium]
MTLRVDASCIVIYAGNNARPSGGSRGRECAIGVTACAVREHTAAGVHLIQHALQTPVTV